MNKIRVFSVFVLLICVFAQSYELNLSTQQTRDMIELNGRLQAVLKFQEGVLESQRKTIDMQRDVIEKQRAILTLRKAGANGR